MIDTDKVIRHIAAEIAIAEVCKKGFATVDIDMLSDALALLKKQEPAKVRHLHGTKVTVHAEIVFEDACENCGSCLLKHWKACPICGKQVKWDA